MATEKNLPLNHDQVPPTDDLMTWVPVITIVNDNDRRVMHVTDWVGGFGVKPIAGGYIGAGGYTPNIGEAVDVRGGVGGIGNTGAAGSNGWTPRLAVVNDGNRRVLFVSAWIGGTGTEPQRYVYVGANGFVSSIGEAVDIRGGTGAAGLDGLDGDTGPRGYVGWSPVFSAQPIGDRVVLRVVDWTGGEGQKPAVGQYIGSSGFVTDPAQAVDIRGISASSSRYHLDTNDVGGAPSYGNDFTLPLTHFTRTPVVGETMSFIVFGADSFSGRVWQGFAIVTYLIWPVISVQLNWSAVKEFP